ncbi:polyketide synthase dehydratase domain-containing protein, partial [Anaeromyxobacter oryzisoli]|uniref:polyketide synthase dehydratase domain-containing protein n=1 Tax=Anaeromyxobacter oryzisoli TaxID=2925408 RepID=UPI001F578A01
ALADHPWLAGYALFGNVLLPGSAFLELALAAAHRVGLDRVEDLTVETPLALPAHGAVLLQVSVAPPDETGRRRLALHARPEDALSWTCHATGLLGPAAPSAPFDLRTWPPEGASPLPLDGLYDRLAHLGLSCAPELQALTTVWKLGDDLFAEVRLPASSTAGFGLHPALLEAAFHALALNDADQIVLPSSWSGASLRAAGASSLRVRLSLPAGGPPSLRIADS